MTSMHGQTMHPAALAKAWDDATAKLGSKINDPVSILATARENAIRECIDALPKDGGGYYTTDGTVAGCRKTLEKLIKPEPCPVDAMALAMRNAAQPDMVCLAPSETWRAAARFAISKGAKL